MKDTTPSKYMTPDSNRDIEVDECPVCLAKTVVQDSLPYLAAAVRQVSEFSASDECEDFEYVATQLEHLNASIATVRTMLKTLERCDCENSGDAQPDEDSVTYMVSEESQRLYDT